MLLNYQFATSHNHQRPLALLLFIPSGNPASAARCDSPIVAEKDNLASLTLELLIECDAKTHHDSPKDF